MSIKDIHGEDLLARRLNKISFPKETQKKGPSPKEIRALEKRAQIMQAAVQVFTKKGYPEGTVTDIARKAGVSYGLAYNYFKNKDDILFSIFRERWQRFIDYIERVRREDILPGIQLQKVGNFLIRSYEQEPDLMKVLVLYVVPNSKFYEKNIRAVKEAFRLIQGIIEEGQQKGVFNKALDSHIATFGFYGAILQILVGWIQGIIPNTPSHFAKAYKFIQLSVESWAGKLILQKT